MCTQKFNAHNITNVLISKYFWYSLRFPLLIKFFINVFNFHSISIPHCTQGVLNFLKSKHLPKQLKQNFLRDFTIVTGQSICPTTIKIGKLYFKARKEFRSISAKLSHEGGQSFSPYVRLFIDYCRQLLRKKLRNLLFSSFIGL